MKRVLAQGSPLFRIALSWDFRVVLNYEDCDDESLFL
jgi:hypothetical protein